MLTVITSKPPANRDESVIVVDDVYELPESGKVRVTDATAPLVLELAEILNLNSVCSSLGFGIYHWQHSVRLVVVNSKTSESQN